MEKGLTGLSVPWGPPGEQPDLSPRHETHQKKGRNCPSNVAQAKGAIATFSGVQEGDDLGTV